MEVRATAFDILSYLFPGMVYLSALLFAYDKFEFASNAITKDNSLSILVTAAIAAYILGQAMQPLYKLNPLALLFKKKSGSNYSEILMAMNPSLNTVLQQQGYSPRAVFLRLLELQSVDLHNTPSRFLAKASFMRNLSTAFLALFIAIAARYEFWLDMQSLFLMVFVLVFSITSMYRSRTYGHWVNSSLMEGLVALEINKNELLTQNCNFLKIVSGLEKK